MKERQSEELLQSMGLGRDRAGDEKEQTEMIMDMWLGEKRPTGSREY